MHGWFDAALVLAHELCTAQVVNRRIFKAGRQGLCFPMHIRICLELANGLNIMCAEICGVSWELSDANVDVVKQGGM